MSSFDVPQAGDAALVDHGTPHAVRSVLEYSVWADLDPQDALVSGRDSALRANRILSVSADVEEKIDDGICAYVSQGEIIKGLVNSRAERKTRDNRYIEVYISLDCRPKIDLKPYISFVDEIEG